MIKKASLVVALCCSIVTASFGLARAENEADVHLRVENRLADVLAKLDGELSSVVARLSTLDISSAEARDIARRCASHPYSVDCVIFDAKGVMKVVEPAEYTRYEGTDLGTDPGIIHLRETKRPRLSNRIRVVEGMDAVVAQHPILSPRKEFIGSLSVVIRPEILIAKVVEPIVKTTPYECMVMQKDGLVLYDAHQEEIGTNLNTNPLYRDFPALLEAGRKMAQEGKGAATYRFVKRGTEGTIRKEIRWSTVRLYGTEWRVAVISELAEKTSGK